MSLEKEDYMVCSFGVMVASERRDACRRVTSNVVGVEGRIAQDRDGLRCKASNKLMNLENFFAYLD